MRLSTFVISPLLATILFSCRHDAVPLRPDGPPLSENQLVPTDATVRFSEIEGGCWALETSKGTYEPLNLPPAYRVHGLRVHVVMRGAPNYYSVCMMAPLVSLDTISRR
jgi:hypothetical protein